MGLIRAFFFPKDGNLGVLKSIATTTRRWVSEGGGAGRGVGGSGGRPQPGNPGPAGRCSLSAGREHHSACVTFAPDRILSTHRIPSGRMGGDLEENGDFL